MEVQQTKIGLQIAINTGGTVGCSDGAFSTTPTCGWAKDVSGKQISNSQGFCCFCSLEQLSGGTFGTVTVTRGSHIPLRIFVLQEDRSGAFFAK